jgi:hypothetical protein
VFAPFETRPPMSGQLVSTPDGKPVAGAEVIVDTLTSFGQEEVDSVTTRTDERGRWSVHRKLEWWATIVGVPEGLSWSPRVTFRDGERAATIGIWDVPRRPSGGVVDRDGWQARFDAHGRNEGPRAVPIFGVMGGRSQLVCAYGGGLLFLTHFPVRLAMRGEGELGIKGAAAFGGLALGAPTQTMPFLNFDVGARIFRPWDGTSSGGAALGPEISFELLSIRVAFASVRSFSPDASGAHVWTKQVLVGLGYM